MLLSVFLFFFFFKFPSSGADKGGSAADKRCVVAAVEIWTTILIVIACRPTFPVGTRMAVQPTRLLQRQRADWCVLTGGSRTYRHVAASAALHIWLRVGEKWVWRSRNGDSRTWINRAGSVRTLLALWFLGNCCAQLVVLLTGRHFLLKVAAQMF